VAQAAPIDVTEGADFGNTNSSTTTLGTLDIGVNTVAGSVDRLASDNFDFWNAELPAGLEITAIEINVSAPRGSDWRAIVEDRVISTLDDLNFQAWLTESTPGLSTDKGPRGSSSSESSSRVDESERCRPCDPTRCAASPWPTPARARPPPSDATSQHSSRPKTVSTSPTRMGFKTALEAVD